MKNKQVIEQWLEGRQVLRTRARASLTTDGRYLYSYALPIARYLSSDNHPIVYNYSRTLGGEFVSVTTAQHISLTLKTIYENSFESLLVRPDYDD